MAPVLSLPITHYPSFLGLIIPLGPLASTGQTTIIRLLILSSLYIQLVA